jgi:FkbM family methyltransferase
MTGFSFKANPLCDQLRLFRDRLSRMTFTPRCVTHQYGGIPLTLKICDRMAKTWYDRDWDELPEVTFLKRRKLRYGAKVFELGAHQAQVALTLATIVGPEGVVVALEASPYNCKIAADNIVLNQVSNVTLLNAAVGERDGKVSFNQGFNGRVGRGREVECLSIDTLSATYGCPDVVFLDVEGYELKSLSGAEQTLRSQADWFVEVHSGCGLELFGGSAADVVELFKLHGYSLFVQTDEHYKHQFSPLVQIPTRRFFLIASRDEVASSQEKMESRCHVGGE